MAERNINSKPWPCRTINTKLIDVLKSSRWEPVTESPSLKLSPLYVYLQQEESSSISYITHTKIYFEVLYHGVRVIVLFHDGLQPLEIGSDPETGLEEADVPPPPRSSLYCVIVGIHWAKYFKHQLQQLFLFFPLHPMESITSSKDHSLLIPKE